MAQSQNGILYCILKRNELLINAITWMHLKSMLNKEARQERVHTLWFHLYKILEQATLNVR